MNFIAVCSLGFSLPFLSSFHSTRAFSHGGKVASTATASRSPRFIEVNLVSSASSLPLLSFPLSRDFSEFLKIPGSG